ncbi:subtilisin inhibitor CLSI-I [Trifolium repens]|nr:subtilisin inhibitor CLSI-I [Trifolium repens]
MAEEKQGHGINLPQVQPNEPLPRTYNQLLGTNNPTKTSWPELVGVTAEEAERKIKEEKSGAEIQVVPPDSFVTADYRTQRVRLYVDESNKVIRTPGIG